MKQNSLKFEPFDLCIFADFCTKKDLFFANQTSSPKGISSPEGASSRVRDIIPIRGTLNKKILSKKRTLVSKLSTLRGCNLINSLPPRLSAMSPQSHKLFSKVLSWQV